MFKDFLYKYRAFFYVNYNFQQGSSLDIKTRDFLIDFIKFLEPRFYNPGNKQFMQDQYEEIFEVIYITKGTVGVGYRLFDEVFYGARISMNARGKYRPNMSAINDYSCISKKCSEFLYMPIEYTEALSIRRENFQNVMDSKSIHKEESSRLKTEITRIYKEVI